MISRWRRAVDACFPTARRVPPNFDPSLSGWKRTTRGCILKGPFTSSCTTCQTTVARSWESSMPARRPFRAGRPSIRLNDVLVSTPELALVQAATQEKNLVALLELGWELCGSYRTARTSLQPAYQVEPLTTTKALRDFVSRNASLDGAGKVARILPYFADGSASPRETKLALILGLPMMHGGQGLGIPSMNHEVPANGAAWAISHRKGLPLRCVLAGSETRRGVPEQGKPRGREQPHPRFKEGERARCHGLDRRRRDQRRTRQPCRHGRDRRWPSPTFREAEANAHPRSSCTQAEAPGGALGLPAGYE